MTKFADTLFETPDNWGETVTTDEDEMRKTIESLHDLGDDWESCNISECQELKLVKPIKRNIVLYRVRNVRRSEYRLYQKDGKYYTLYRLPKLWRAAQFFVESDADAIKEADEYLS